MKILLLGTCQMMSYDTLMKAANLGDTTVLRFMDVTDEHTETGWLDQFDMVLTHNQAQKWQKLWAALQSHRNVLLSPVLFFDGFTPDDEVSVCMSPERGPVMLSRIAVGAHRNGLSRDEALHLYTPAFCDLLGYPDVLERARRNLVAQFSPVIPQIEHLYSKWYAKGPFFFTSNHPMLLVVEDVLREVMRGQKDMTLPPHLSDICVDPLRAFQISPQMNHSDAFNLLTDPMHCRREGSTIWSCSTFVDRCYNLLGQHGKTVVYNQNANRTFDAALAKWRSRAPAAPVANPYRSQPDRAFWARAVARPKPGDISPIGQTTPLIERDTKVATAGSCFAQHVARAMVADGLNYHVAEKAPAGMDAPTADAQGYGLFSARYGNIYSSRQLLQLFHRAYDAFTPIETAWPVKNGFVDPFRPNIGETFKSPRVVEDAREEHLAKVRAMFEDLDVFVFTMGLTEGWIDRRDGAAFPVAPAAVSDGIDPKTFGFVNSDYTTIQREMGEFLACLGRVNPKARVVLTVSPVPLIATYTGTDALSATTYSKSVLRAVAGDLATQFAHVSYFPSFEIITGNHARGGYFETDLRSVRPEGVDHVMRVFRDILVVKDTEQPALPPAAEPGLPDAEYLRQANVVCDEEMLVR